MKVILGFFFLIPILYFILNNILTSFLMLIWIYFFSGFGWGILFCKNFKLNNLFFLVVSSLIAGTIGFNLFTLSIGHLGFEVLGSNFWLITFFTILVSLVLVYFNKTLLFKSTYFQHNLKIKSHRLFFLSIFLFYFVAIIFNLKNYFPNWDHFTFWLLDAGIIFDSLKLKIDYNVINNIPYTSYYPLQASFLFYLMGEIKEQYASFITIYYSFLANLIVYASVIDKKRLTRNITVLLLLMVNWLFFHLTYLFTYYAEVAVAFHVVLGYYLLSLKISVDNYKNVFYLLALNLLALSSIKHFNYVYSVSIFLFYLLLNYSYILKNRMRFIKSILSSKFFIVFIFFVVLARIYYVNYIWQIPGDTSLTKLVSFHPELNILNYIEYTGNLFSLIYKTYGLFIYFILSVLLIFIFKGK